jgi:hypothetical protein
MMPKKPKNQNMILSVNDLDCCQMTYKTLYEIESLRT